jgi:ribosomal protein L37E
MVESMAAGCIVLASPVGAFPEIVRHGWNGFLVAGAHTDPSTWAQAADLVLRLTRNAAWTNYLRHNARQGPFDWDVIAQAWEGYWMWALEGMQADGQHDLGGLPECSECGHRSLALRDGYHCTGCGFYRQAL